MMSSTQEQSLITKAVMMIMMIIKAVFDLFNSTIGYSPEQPVARFEGACE